MQLADVSRKIAVRVFRTSREAMSSRFHAGPMNTEQTATKQQIIILRYFLMGTKFCTHFHDFFSSVFRQFFTRINKSSLKMQTITNSLLIKTINLFVTRATN